MINKEKRKKGRRELLFRVEYKGRKKEAAGFIYHFFHKDVHI